MVDNVVLKKFLDRMFKVSVGEEANKVFDQVAQGMGVLTAIFFLFHKLSPGKIEAISNEDLVATLLTYGWSDSTTRPITNELVRRKHFFSWHMIRLSGVDPNDLGRRALEEMQNLAQSGDELNAVAKCDHPLLFEEYLKERDKLFEKFCEDFLK